MSTDPTTDRPAVILVVDDEETNRTLLERVLTKEGYEIVTAVDGRGALTLLSGVKVDLVLLDVQMPGIDGIEVCRRIRKKVDLPHLPVVMVTSLTDRWSRIACKEAGCDDFLSKPVDFTELAVRVRNLLTVKRFNEQLERDREWLEQEVQKRTAELQTALADLTSAQQQVRVSQQEIIRRLATATEYRDDETGAHILRMSSYARLLAEKRGLDDDRVQAIFEASPMHDVGKVGIPDRVLLKPGRLTDEEFETMKGHAEIGYRILAGSPSELVKLASVIAWTHHEKYDGTGYPRGLSGEAIPLEGRICAIADVFDALTSDRCYRPAMEVEKAVQIMREGWDTQFDPVLLDLFLDSLDEVLAIRDKYGK